MAKIATHYDLEMEVLSPLHVGTGNNLQEGFDYVLRERRTYVVNQDALLELVLARAEEAGTRDVERVLLGLSLHDLEEAGYLEPADFRDRTSPLFRYVLEGTPSLRQIGEQIKDVYGQPYLPGSSLKGALRTVLAWEAVRTGESKVEAGRLDRRAKYAAHSIEEEIFGRDPNHDLLRALQVSDSAPVPVDRLALTTVRIYPTARRADQRGLDLDVEAIQPGTILRAGIKLDEFLFGGKAERELRFGKRRRWLTDLPRLGRNHTLSRIKAEISYFEGRRDVDGVQEFYRRLATLQEQSKGSDQFLVQVGWGGGWGSKTLGTHLSEDGPLMGRLMRDYRLKRRGAWQPGQPFPASRRLAWEGSKPALPMGWLLVKMSERS